jgi:hypothetical protein
MFPPNGALTSWIRMRQPSVCFKAVGKLNRESKTFLLTKNDAVEELILFNVSSKYLNLTLGESVDAALTGNWKVFPSHDTDSRGSASVLSRMTTRRDMMFACCGLVSRRVYYWSSCMTLDRPSDWNWLKDFDGIQTLFLLKSIFFLTEIRWLVSTESDAFRDWSLSW